VTGPSTNYNAARLSLDAGITTIRSGIIISENFKPEGLWQSFPLKKYTAPRPSRRFALRL
jgi:hypothetical protein